MPNQVGRKTYPVAEPLGRYGIAVEDSLPNLATDVSPSSLQETPSEIFSSLVENNPLVCPACFRRKKTRRKVEGQMVEYYASHGKSGTSKTADERGRMESNVDQYIPPGAKHPLLEREFYETTPIRDRTTQEYLTETAVEGKREYADIIDATGSEFEAPGPVVRASRAAAGTKMWACSGCGNIEKPKSTLSKPEAVDAAFNLSLTLQEYGIGHDWVHLVELVRELKMIEGVQADDSRVFTQAVEEAVRSIDSSPTVDESTTRPATLSA